MKKISDKSLTKKLRLKGMEGMVYLPIYFIVGGAIGYATTKKVKSSLLYAIGLPLGLVVIGNVYDKYFVTNKQPARIPTDITYSFRDLEVVKK